MPGPVAVATRQALASGRGDLRGIFHLSHKFKKRSLAAMNNDEKARFVAQKKIPRWVHTQHRQHSAHLSHPWQSLASLRDQQGGQPEFCALIGPAAAV